MTRPEHGDLAMNSFGLLVLDLKFSSIECAGDSRYSSGCLSIPSADAFRSTVIDKS